MGRFWLLLALCGWVCAWWRYSSEHAIITWSWLDLIHTANTISSCITTWSSLWECLLHALKPQIYSNKIQHGISIWNKNGHSSVTAGMCVQEFIHKAKLETDREEMHERENVKCWPVKQKNKKGEVLSFGSYAVPFSFQRERHVTKLTVTSLHGANKVSWKDSEGRLFSTGGKCQHMRVCYSNPEKHVYI